MDPKQRRYYDPATQPLPRGLRKMFKRRYVPRTPTTPLDEQLVARAEAKRRRRAAVRIAQAKGVAA